MSGAKEKVQDVRRGRGGGGLIGRRFKALPGASRGGLRYLPVVLTPAHADTWTSGKRLEGVRETRTLRQEGLNSLYVPGAEQAGALAELIAAVGGVRGLLDAVAGTQPLIQEIDWRQLAAARF